jgi:hypothetical protein
MYFWDFYIWEDYVWDCFVREKFMAPVAQFFRRVIKMTNDEDLIIFLFFYILSKNVQMSNLQKDTKIMSFWTDFKSIFKKIILSES